MPGGAGLPASCSQRQFYYDTVGQTWNGCYASNLWEQFVTAPSAGSANQILGINGSNNGREWKTFAAGNGAQITNGAGTVTIATTKATTSEINAGSDTAKNVSAAGLQASKYVDNTGGKIYAVTTNSGNNYSASLNPAPAALTPGLTVRLKFNANNTAAASLDLNSLGSAPIVKNGSTALASGDITIDLVRELTYDGTNWQIVGDGIGSSTSAVGASESQTYLFEEF